MRRRWIALLLLLALVAALLAMPVQGAAALCFVAVNDAIPLTLSGDDLPFYAGGTLYMPHTSFGSASVGFFSAYNADERIMSLFSRSQRLVFDLSNGTVADEDDNIYVVSAVSRNGNIFLPAAFCASHFGIQLSVLTSQGGYPVIRFTNGSQVYDDGLFLEKAENLISYRVEQYLAPTQEPPAETQPPVQQPAPSTPAQPQAPQTPEEPEAPPPARLYLAVTGTEGAEAALEALAGFRVHAVFYLSAGEIAANEDLVRRIAAGGHLLGVAAGETDPAGDLRRANEALDHALKRKTLLALVPSAADAAALEGRYCLARLPEQPPTAQEAAEAHGQTAQFICPADQLPAALSVLQAAQSELLPPTETALAAAEPG